jgi:hypothetical protein
MLGYSNFHRLDPAARDVALELEAQADGQSNPFMSFVFRWMAFNGWMAAVTEEDNDRKMIDALAEAPRVIAAFDAKLAEDVAFRELVQTFAAMWPVLSVHDVRKKLGFDAFHRLERPLLLAECAAENVKQRPADSVPGSVPDWAQVLRTVYQVRCNLFHGEKSPQNGRDYNLVVTSDRLLRAFVVDSGCFGWYGE